MKQNKVFCDICGHDINVDKDRGIALYSHLTIISSLLIREISSIAQQDSKMKKDEIDVCEECAKKIDKYIETIKIKKI